MVGDDAVCTQVEQPVGERGVVDGVNPDFEAVLMRVLHGSLAHEPVSHHYSGAGHLRFFETRGAQPF